MVAEQLTRHRASLTSVDELWDVVQAEWAPVPVYAIQSLRLSADGIRMPVLVVLHFSEFMLSIFLKI